MSCMVNRAVCAAALFWVADLLAVPSILIDEQSEAWALIPSLENGGNTLGESWKGVANPANIGQWQTCLLYTSPSPRD